ncbi:MAG: FAD-binding protein, partial [Cyclobacteriaceae bacterium]|nr:FAD-binding protein [Cyclobacteriaceae bacterium]
ERGLIRPGNSVPRFHMVWGTGWALIKTLIKHLENHPKSNNLKIICRHRATEIMAEQSSIKGVRGTNEQTGSPFTALANQIVIATGGINGSIERVKENWYKPWGKPPEVILNGAHEYAIGDLHDATSQINGNVVNLEKQWNYVAGIRHYKPRHEGHGLSIVPGKSQLWLNYEGRRFGPMPLMSPYDTRYLVEQICKEPIKYSWQLLNMKIASKEFAISGSEHNELVRDKKFLQFLLKTAFVGNKKLVQKIADNCEDMILAESLPELVDKMNALTGDNYVKLKYIQQAVENYDGQITRGFFNDEQLRRIQYVRKYKGDRVRTCNLQRILDPKAGPLIAIRSFIISRKSLGGIQTNLKSMVLTKPDADGKQEPIPGLYAVGEAAGFGGGGMHGLGSLEGTFLGGCVISARVAAAHILNKSLS